MAAIAETTIAARNEDWHNALRRIQSRPLEFCPGFPEIACRWENWWRFESDRPLFVAQTPKAQPGPSGKAFNLIEDPASWLQHRRAQVESTHYVGEALPSVRVDIGPVSMAAYLGAPLTLAHEENTSWNEPIIESWDRPNLIHLDPENTWLTRVLGLMEVVAQDAAGSYLVCTPDITGSIDTLSNMRDPQRLCLDLYENRDEIKRAALEVVDAWEQVFVRMYDTALSNNTGIIQWVSAWSETPITVPTCDFNALIGSVDFVDVCLPSLEEQARRAGRCLIHVDGPAAARHALSLAESPAITAIQYTPGAGTPSALEKAPLLRKIQDLGVPVFVETPAHEVRELSEALDPRGLAMRVEGIRKPQEADDLFAWVERNFR